MKYLKESLVVLLLVAIVGVIPAYAMTDAQEQQVLLKCYTQASYEAFQKGDKACGYITKRTQELAKDQNVTVYAGYITLDDGREHLAPVILLDNGIYYGYENQANVYLTSAFNGRYEAYILGDWKYEEVTKVGYPKGTVYIPLEFTRSHPTGKVYLRSIYIDDLQYVDVSFWGNLFAKINTIHVQYKGSNNEGKDHI